MHLAFHEIERLIPAQVEISEVNSVGDLAQVRAVLRSSVLSPGLALGDFVVHGKRKAGRQGG